METHKSKNFYGNTCYQLIQETIDLVWSGITVDRSKEKTNWYTVCHSTAYGPPLRPNTYVSFLRQLPIGETSCSNASLRQGLHQSRNHFYSCKPAFLFHFRCFRTALTMGYELWCITSSSPCSAHFGFSIVVSYIALVDLSYLRRSPLR